MAGKIRKLGPVINGKLVHAGVQLAATFCFAFLQRPAAARERDQNRQNATQLLINHYADVNVVHKNWPRVRKKSVREQMKFKHELYATKETMIIQTNLTENNENT